MENKYKKVSDELGLPLEVVKKAYQSFWHFIKTTIQELPLKDDLTEEEFRKLRTNFNIPSIGKLSCTYDRYLGMKERYAYIKKLRKDAKNKEDKANV